MAHYCFTPGFIILVSSLAVLIAAVASPYWQRQEVFRINSGLFYQCLSGQDECRELQDVSAGLQAIRIISVFGIFIGVLALVLGILHVKGKGHSAKVNRLLLLATNGLILGACLLSSGPSLAYCIFIFDREDPDTSLHFAPWGTFIATGGLGASAYFITKHSAKDRTRISDLSIGRKKKRKSPPRIHKRLVREHQQTTQFQQPIKQVPNFSLPIHQHPNTNFVPVGTPLQPAYPPVYPEYPPCLGAETGAANQSLYQRYTLPQAPPPEVQGLEYSHSTYSSISQAPPPTIHRPLGI